MELKVKREEEQRSRVSRRGLSPSFLLSGSLSEAQKQKALQENIQSSHMLNTDQIKMDDMTAPQK